MKTLAILLCSALSLTACATDDYDSRTFTPGLRPEFKPEIADLLANDQRMSEDSTGIDELGEELGDPADQWWAEEIVINGQTLTLLHGPNSRIVLDENGIVLGDSAFDLKK